MRELVASLVSEAVTQAVAAGELNLAEIPAPEPERPRDPSHGDWATTVALRSAKAAGMKPRDIADLIAARMAEHPDIAAVEIAGPGFINLRLSPSRCSECCGTRATKAPTSGASTWGATSECRSSSSRRTRSGRCTSATAAGRRSATAWRACSSTRADDVEREFYVNDAGVQMDIFAKSVAARYLELCGREVEFDDDWYHGAYIIEIAREILDAEGDAWADVARRGARGALQGEGVRAGARAPQARAARHGRRLRRVVLGAHAARDRSGRSDRDRASHRRRCARPATSTSTRARSGSARRTSATTRTACCAKADGEYTYFAADIAYHKDKFDRGFDRVINIWGADHHGYVPRMKAAVAALGHEGQLDVVIGQLVNLFRDGEVVRMSKRTGEMVTFEELLDEVGRRRGALLLPAPLHRPAARLRHRARARSSPPTTPSTTCSTRTRASARSCARPPARDTDDATSTSPSLAAELVPADARPRRCSPTRPSSRSCASSPSSRRSSRRRRAICAPQAHALRRGPRRDVPPVLHACAASSPTTRR